MALAPAGNGSRRWLDAAHGIVSHYKDTGPRPSQHDLAGISV
jgi:hypothetical protein